MTIRSRLTLWYAGILFVSALLIGSISYYEALAEQKKAQLKGEEHEDLEDEVAEHFVRMAVWCGIPAAVLGLGGGWWLMRKAMNPVTALTKAAAQINDTNLSKKLPRTNNGDELDQLTEVFNAMTSRLDDAFNRIREFTLHASHELKTPLTVMNGEIETALREEDCTPAQKERLASQLDEIQRLTKIVDGLTLLTRADAGQVTLKLESVRLDELIRDCLEDAQILAQARKIKVTLGACEPMTIHADRHRLRQLLLNLSDNAVKYNCDGGWVTLDLFTSKDGAEFKIANSGAGIPEEMQPRVFERFFRCDLSHNSAVEGCGLGLSIAQWIVKAHAGTIQISSKQNQPTTVTVQLPARKI